MSYTVQPGDTLSGIASRSGLSWPDLFAINHATISRDKRNSICRRQFGGGPEDWIFPGQIIRIP